MDLHIIIQRAICKSTLCCAKIEREIILTDLILPFVHDSFFWLTQDIFGMAACIMFLGALKLYSIKIATFFLVAVFFYDIFFVFVTPYFTSSGESVMLAVVGSSEDLIDDFCTKYPEESDCTGVT